MTGYPIAETFTSIQGEGAFAGTQMFFIRLAGCNVGKVGADGRTAICTSVDGVEFECDTDYRKTANKSAAELLSQCICSRICITGGEPFLHDLLPLAEEAQKRGIKVHVETSGTRPIPASFLSVLPGEDLWIACSPKKGFLDVNTSLVSEWKFLIDSKTDITKVLQFAEEHCHPPSLTFFQPVNFPKQLDQGNIALIQHLLPNNLDWRISVQLHKVLNVR